MADAVAWVADYALRAGLRYEPEPDERWLRVFEPYVTLRTPLRYEHALSTTGTTSALTIARFVLAPRGGYAVGDEGWIAVGQDERLRGRAAATSDASPVFRDEGTSLLRRETGDPAFDAVFASYAESDEMLRNTIHASIRKLTLGWRAPVHFEIRPGAFVLAPVALRPDPPSLAWLLDAARVFANKAAQAPA
jgi:hypothetical protein